MKKKKIIMNMYKISSKLIDKLKKVEYKINTNRKKLKKNKFPTFTLNFHSIF